MSESVHLEGTTLEGGGQLVRLALGLSALTATPIKITNIRGNRSGGGGLKQQHLTAVNWLTSACSATVSGAEKKNRTLEFCPAKESQEEHPTLLSQIDIGSPGSITLVFQALLPFLLFTSTSKDDPPSPLHLTIKGGTNVSLSPSYDYVHQVLLPTLSLIGLPPITASLNARGWSTGRPEVGSVTFTVQPLSKGATIPAFELKKRGDVVSVQATVLAPRAAEKDFQREIRAEVRRILPTIEDIKVEFELSGHQKRLYVLLVATTSTGCRLGRDWLYSQRITSLSTAVSEMVKRVVNDLDAEITGDSCVDEYMSDQLVVFQALAKGRSMIRSRKEEDGNASEKTLHAQTAWWVVSKMLSVEVDEEGGCDGVGFVVGDRSVVRKKKEEADERLEGLGRLKLEG